MNDRLIDIVPDAPEQPVTAPSAGQQRAGSGMIDIVPDRPVEGPPAPPVNKLEDIGRSAVAKGVQGVVGTVGGGIGSLETFLAKDIPEFARTVGLNVGERMDLISPAEKDKRLAEPLYANQTEMQKKGWQSPFSGTPTYKGFKEGLEQNAADLGAPILGHKPQTTAGKIIGAGIEGAAQGLPGAVRTLPGRMFVGAAAGSAGEAGGELSGGSPLAHVAGALGGGMAAAKLSNAIRATMLPGGAQDELARALAADLRSGTEGMGLGQLRDAMDRGIPVTVYDMAGPQTRKILQRYTALSDDAAEKGRSIVEKLNARTAESGTRTEGFLQTVAGGPLNAPAVEAAEKLANQNSRTQLYGLLRQEPAAQSIPATMFGDVLNRPMVQAAMKEAEKTALNNPDFNIVVPKKVPGTPAVERTIKQTDKGLVETPGAPGAPETMTNGNLAYWDQVKRELDNVISQAERTGDKQAVASAQSAKRAIVAKLDNHVGSYKATRDAAAETFDADNAIRAGSKFFRTSDQFKRSELAQKMAGFSEENKELFRLGVLSEINNRIQNNQLQLVKDFEKPQFVERMTIALGPERVNAVRGQIIAENLTNNVARLKVMAEADPMSAAARAGVAGAALPLSLEGITNLLYNAPFFGSNKLLGAAVVTGAAGAGSKLALSRMERATAERVLTLANSGNPKDLERLGQLAQAYPLINQVFNKLNTALAAAGVQYSGAQSARAERASGGRIALDHEAEADRLIAAAEKAKHHHSSTTKQLLGHDDSTIAQALKIANKHI